MRFQLLGPLTITDDTDAVVLQPSKPTILLATLLLHADSVVSAPYLQQTIWGPDQPTTAKAALQTCVLRLRRLFARLSVTTTSIDAVPGGYRVTAGPTTLDLLDFRARIRDAEGLAADPAAELAVLRQALALWQGPVLANVPSEVLHRDEVPRLVEERLRTVERVCDLELSLGRSGAALVELWKVTRDHPGHERFREQLIEALYLSGRQADALTEYRGIKTYLREELGVDPSPALQRLELAILRGDDLGRSARGRRVRRVAGDSATTARRSAEDDSAAYEPARDEPSGDGRPPAAAASCTGADEPTDPGTPFVRGAQPRPYGAPCGRLLGGPGRARRLLPRASAAMSSAPQEVTAPLTDVPCFAGRADLTAAVTARLANAGEGPATVLLSGAPGVGKTALARHAAHLVRARYPGGAVLIRMTGPDGRPRSDAEAAAAVEVTLSQADGPVLLVLDDVVDADQVRPLLPVGPAGAAIITSRRRLAGLVATHGVRVHRLGVFHGRESRQLMAAMLGATRVKAEPEAARRLAAACGEFPLAVRIVASWLSTRPSLSLGAAADWLAADPLPRLYIGDDPADPAMSVRAFLGTALERLDQRCAEVFLRLGSLPGAPAEGFGAEDAAALLQDPSRGEAEAVLERLADAGLLEDGPPGPYRMHALLRTYARHTAAARGTGGRTGAPAGLRSTWRPPQKV